MVRAILNKTERDRVIGAMKNNFSQDDEKLCRYLMNFLKKSMTNKCCFNV